MKTMTKLFAILTILATGAPASAVIIGGDDAFEGEAIIGTGSPSRSRIAVIIGGDDAPSVIIGGDQDEIQPPCIG